MRKTVFITLGFGLIGSILLFLVRQTDWYDAQMRQTMSDFGELADSAFWASLITLVFGLVLLLVWLRRRGSGPEKDGKDPAPLTVHWICPHCGGSNTQLDRICQTCGQSRPLTMPPWTCEWCGAENAGGDRFCASCGKPRPTPDHNWTCAWCGTENPGQNRTCSVCGRPQGGQEPAWTCAWCGTENPGRNETCSVCGNPHAEPTWSCPNCGTDNPLRQRTCLVCGAARVMRPAPPRTCARCGGKLEPWDTVCPRCGCVTEP